jgi:hydroxyacylglutathione hydrolase
LDAADVLAGLSTRTRWVLDLRPASQFADGFLEGSLSLPYSKSFSTWAGSIIPVTDELVLMSDGNDDAVRLAVRDLSRIGFDRMVGWVAASDALQAWREAGHGLPTLPQMSVTDVSSMRTDRAATVIDVRGRTEWDAGHIGGAVHVPLGDLRQRVTELPSTPLLVHCQSGARSAVATSLLHRLGRTDAVNIRGGFVAWSAAGLPTAGPHA